MSRCGRMDGKAGGRRRINPSRSRRRPCPGRRPPAAGAPGERIAPGGGAADGKHAGKAAAFAPGADGGGQSGLDSGSPAHGGAGPGPSLYRRTRGAGGSGRPAVLLGGRGAGRLGQVVRPVGSQRGRRAAAHPAGGGLEPGARRGQGPDQGRGTGQTIRDVGGCWPGWRWRSACCRRGLWISN